MTKGTRNQDEHVTSDPDIKSLDTYSKGDLLRVLERTILRMDQFKENTSIWSGMRVRMKLCEMGQPGQKCN